LWQASRWARAAKNAIISAVTQRNIISLTVAILVAILGASLAPSDWDQGPGSVRLRVRGTEVISARVVLGDRNPIELASDALELVFEEGIPVDETIVAVIRGKDAAWAAEVGINDFELALTLPDGSVESIPVITFDDQDLVFRAQRRPPHNTSTVLGLLGFVLVAWVTEALPIFVTSLVIPVVLVVGGVVGPFDATAPFFHPIIVLFFAGFLMAEAMRSSRLDHFVSVSIIALAGRNGPLLFATMIGFASFMSMWMSNTAAIAILVPLAIAVTAPLDHPGFRKAAILGIAYAGTIGGVGSAIGTPANQLAIEFLDTFTGRSISFVEWFAFGLPMVVVFLPVMGLYLWWRAGATVDPVRFEEARRIAEAERRDLGSFDRHQVRVLAAFGLVFIGWLTQTTHGVHPGIVALAGAIALFVVRELEPEALGRISWSALIAFGGGLALGLALVSSGTSDYLATRLGVLSSVPPTLALLAVAGIALALTTVASNTASAAILIPVALPLSAVIGIDPTPLIVMVAIASSVDFALVIGTPPTMIAYSTRLYSAAEIFRTGIVLDLVGLLLLVFGVTQIWDWLGLF
jgi:sodium-dependent dicarboxylate transporter 2/3/5